MQALEVILKSAFHQDRLMKNGIQGGRSFFLRPQRSFYLGDFYELWLGLFQSLVLGKMPMLNVDVNHKAFPKRYPSMIELLRDMEQDLNTRIDFNRPFDRIVENTLARHLGGLEICYDQGGGVKKVYKFMQVVGNPAREKFRMENGQEKTIEQYFRETNRRIQHPGLPCIKLGNTITVPMEFCSIPDSQVNTYFIINLIYTYVLITIRINNEKH